MPRPVLRFVVWLTVAAMCGVSACAAQVKPGDSLFEFHSGFWINLHHFLYLQAVLSESQKGARWPALTAADSAHLKQLAPAERAAWDKAVAIYRVSFAKRELLFDDELIAAKEELEDNENSSDLAKAKTSAAMRTALIEAAPIYRKHWWPRHDADNRKWIADLTPKVSQYGAGLAADLSRIYDAPWPDHPVRVDAVAYADWAGAYTTIYPTRPTISTTNPANQGAAALEIVFHETSHGMMKNVMDAMRAAESDVNAHRTGASFHAGSIWHAVLFYTAGELVAERVAGYVPYADKNGLWVRAWPDPDRSLIEKDWKPHMSGSMKLEQSLTKLMGDLAAQPQHK